MKKTQRNVPSANNHTSAADSSVVNFRHQSLLRQSSSLAACGQKLGCYHLADHGTYSIASRNCVAGGWLSEQQFNNALGFCMMLPGPSFGWQLILMAASWSTGWVTSWRFIHFTGRASDARTCDWLCLFWHDRLGRSLFNGLKAGVSVIVLKLIKLAKRGLTNLADWLIAIAGFVGTPLLMCHFFDHYYCWL